MVDKIRHVLAHLYKLIFSLLLLMIPGKYQDHSDLLVTCCDSAEFCQGEDNNNIFIKVFAEPNYNNLTAFCQTDSFGLAAGERY